MANAEDLGDSEIEPVPVTPPSCDRPEYSRTSNLDKLKPPTKSDLYSTQKEIITLIAYYARRCLLKLKLCWHNLLMPNETVAWQPVAL